MYAATPRMAPNDAWNNPAPLSVRGSHALTSFPVTWRKIAHEIGNNIKSKLQITIYVTATAGRHFRCNHSSVWFSVVIYFARSDAGIQLGSEVLCLRTSCYECRPHISNCRFDVLVISSNISQRIYGFVKYRTS